MQVVRHLNSVFLFVFAILTFAVFAVGMVLIDIEMGNVLQVIVPLFLVVSAVLAVGVVVLDLFDFETLVNIGRFLFIIAGYVIIGSSSAALPLFRHNVAASTVTLGRAS